MSPVPLGRTGPLADSSYICERDILNRTKKHSLEKLASKQKTFRIFKERSRREASRDQSNPPLRWTRIIARISYVAQAAGWSACRAGRREGWWSQSGSNRRPPACKAGALPAELWPHFLKHGWWVWEELHLRPHPYQGCALTN
jgi:hypothetical protein